MKPSLLEESLSKTGIGHLNSSSPPGHLNTPSHLRIQNRHMGMIPSTNTHRVAVSYIQVHRLLLVLTTLISSYINDPEYRLRLIRLVPKSTRVIHFLWVTIAKGFLESKVKLAL
jgi:hypothetical protein